MDTASRWLCGVALLSLWLGLPTAARAGVSITIKVDGFSLITVGDNMPGDINPAVGDITYPFAVQDQAVDPDWVATGTIFAKGGLDGFAPVTTVVTDTLIERVSMGLGENGLIEVIHTFGNSVDDIHFAELDGFFFNTVETKEIGNITLDYAAFANDSLIGATNYAASSGFTFEFFEILGPHAEPSAASHTSRFCFYLDEFGDAISLPNSADIFLPEPGSMLLFAAGVPWLMRRVRVSASSGC